MEPHFGDEVLDFPGTSEKVQQTAGRISNGRNKWNLLWSSSLPIELDKSVSLSLSTRVTSMASADESVSRVPLPLQIPPVSYVSTFCASRVRLDVTECPVPTAS